MRKARRVQPRAERTRASILKAAEALFAERGFAATRLEDVAARVGITRPSIVYHFRDKRELYDTVLDDMFGSLLARIETALSGPGLIGKRIEAVVRAWVGYVAERPSVARVLLREVAEASGARSPAVARRVGPIIAAIQEAIGNGQREGKLQAMDPIHFVFTIAGATVFFVSATPALAPEWPFDPLSREQLQAHEREVLQMTQRWLGTRGPRLAK